MRNLNFFPHKVSYWKLKYFHGFHKTNTPYLDFHFFRNFMDSYGYTTPQYNRQQIHKYLLYFSFNIAYIHQSLPYYSDFVFFCEWTLCFYWKNIYISHSLSTFETVRSLRNFFFLKIRYSLVLSLGFFLSSEMNSNQFHC